MSSNPTFTPPTFPETFNLADHCLFARLEEGLGAQVALRFGERAYTYEQVAARTKRLAVLLREHGVRSEERVLIALPDVPAFAWSFFGVVKTGAVVAMANPDLPAKDLAYLLEYTRASALIAVPKVITQLTAEIERSPSLRTVLVVADAPTDADPDAMPAPVEVRTKRSAILSEALRSAPDPNVEIPPTKRDDVAVWLFTSGSTGQSKAAVHTHRDFAFNIEVYAKRTVGYRRGDVTASVSRLYFGYATGTNLMFPFAVGGTVGLFSERPTPEALISAINRYKPTVLTNVPTMIGKLLEHDAQLRATGDQGLDLSSLRFCLSAGEALPPSLLDRWTARWGIDVYDGIGSAEMFHIYISNRPGDIKPGSLGKVVEGYEAKILPQDAQGPGAEPVPAGEVGTLWIKGDSVAICYWQDRDKSWRTFHGYWCCTGDLFRVDEQGYYWFGGRADELLKVSGLWVSPLEVEECLLRHPAVVECAVIGVDDGGGLMKTRAYVVARAGYEPGEALASDIQGYVKQRLAKHKYPREVVFVADLPKNDRGKIDRKTLKQQAGAR